MPTVRLLLSTGPRGSASNTRSSAPAVPTTASAASAAGRPVPRSVGGCNGPATIAGALLVEGVGVGCPARYGVEPAGGDTSGCTGGGAAVGVLAGGVGGPALGDGAVDDWCAGDDV